MKRTYDFATIGFRPFTETQEFVTMPKDETNHWGVACREIRDALLGDDFIWADEHDTDKVVEFARLPENPVLKLA